jgi:hypothetical protein
MNSLNRESPPDRESTFLQSFSYPVLAPETGNEEGDEGYYSADSQLWNPNPIECGESKKSRVKSFPFGHEYAHDAYDHMA